jgi:membrane associated rhomboid family serine protease
MSITIALVILTGIISYQAFSNPKMKGELIFHPRTIKNSGQFYRFLTHGFIHGSWTHLLINLYVLYEFGEVIEAYFGLIFGEIAGKFVFLLFYLTAVIIAAIPTFFRHQNNSGYAALGASGATSAIVFIYVFLAPWAWFLFPPLPAILFGFGYLWYSSYMDKKGTDHIGHNAHFWGAVYGIVFIIVSTLIFKPELLELFIQQFLAGPEPHPWFS